MVGCGTGRTAQQMDSPTGMGVGGCVEMNTWWDALDIHFPDLLLTLFGQPHFSKDRQKWNGNLTAR